MSSRQPPSLTTLRGAETLRSSGPGDAPAALPALPALTVLWHPDPARVGEVARLVGLAAGHDVALSRVEPVFSAPGETAGDALGDPFLSRRPVTLRPDGDGLVVATDPQGTAVTVDGVPLDGPRAVPLAALADGVVLELGRRVALLLHLAAAPAERPPRLGLVGDNALVERVRADVLRVADLAVPVLLRGETGTGKELVARAIHGASPRRERACVCVNMATVPESVAASELFGHARGAFTGAVRESPGCFVRADGGTLFLDEVGATPPAVQAMLLRVLETGELLPLGAHAPRRVDVRVLAATDADLEAGVRDGRFAQALLHRLAGYEIDLAPLRRRRDDVGRLLVHFLREELDVVGERHRLAPAGPAQSPWLPASLVARLARYDWPGNVRQLRNVVRQLVISNRGAAHLRVDDAVERLLAAVPAPPPPPPPPPPLPSVEKARARRPSEIADDELIAALRAHGWKREPTARHLGISVTSLYVLIDRCPLIRKATALSPDELTRCRDACGGDLERMSERLEVSARGLRLRMRELGLA